MVCPCGGGCPRCASRGRRSTDLHLHSPIAAAQLEREAQEAAEQVTACPTTRAGLPPTPPRLGRASPLQKRAQTASPVPSGGRPLDPAVLTGFEVRFGRSLSQTRIHTGQQAANAARDLDALAYTFGNHIVFGEGQFSPQTPMGRRLLAHELAHVVQQDGASPVIQRAPKKDAPPPPQTFPQFQPADQVVSLKRDANDDWEISLSGHISEQSATRAIWPSRSPFGVTVQLIVAVTDPVDLGTFKLHGVNFQSLSTMEPSIAKLFIAHGLEDETKVRPDVAAARAEFREAHPGHGEWGLDAIDVALKQVTKHNPDLLVAYYSYYAHHKLSDPTWWDRNISNFKRSKDAGMTESGETAINPDILRLQSSFPTSDPTGLSLLGETLIHEYSHTPQGESSNVVWDATKEAKAYAIELFFAERAGDKARAALIEKRYDGTDPYDQATGGNEVYAQTYRILSEIYKAIDAGGPEAEKARRMSVDLISHNEEDYGPDLRDFIKKFAR